MSLMGNIPRGGEADWRQFANDLGEGVGLVDAVPDPIPEPAPRVKFISGPTGVGGGVDAHGLIQQEQAQPVMASQGQMSGQAQPQAQVGPGGQTMGLIGDMAIGNAQAAGDLQAQLDANPMRSVSSANPLHPLVVDQYQDYAGRGGQVAVEPFVPEEFVPTPKADGETDNAYLYRIQGDKMLHDAAQADRKLAWQEEAKATIESAQNEVGNVRTLGDVGRMGLGEADVTSTENVGEAEIQRAEDLADATGEVRDNLQTAETIRQNAGAMIRQDKQQQLEAFQNTQKFEEGVRTKLDTLPQHTIGSVFKNKSTGKKIWAVIGALAGGWNGSDDVIQMIANEANEANKLAREDWEREYASAQGRTAGAQDVYGMAMEQFGDREVAADLNLKFSYEDSERFLKQRIAETAVGPAKAQLQQALVGVEQKRRDVETALEAKMVTTPQRFTTTYDPLGRRKRQQMEQEIADRKKQGFKFGDDAIKASMDGEKLAAESADRQAARADKQIERDMSREKLDFDKKKFVHEQTRDLAKQIAPKQAAIESINRILSTDGLAGIGGFAGTEKAMSTVQGWFGTDQAHILEKQVAHLVEDGLRDATGAAAPPEEQKTYVDFIMEGATGINGEERFKENLKAFSDKLNGEIGVHSRAVSDDASKWMQRKATLQDVDTMNIGPAPLQDDVRRK